LFVRKCFAIIKLLLDAPRILVYYF
jgi:hypothetical protein